MTIKPKYQVMIWSVAFLAIFAVSVAIMQQDLDKTVRTTTTPTPVAQAPVDADPTPLTDVVEAEVATAVAEPEPAREVTYEEAEIAYFDKRYTEAVELFTSYTERKTENPWGHYMLGLSAWRVRDYDTAESALQRSIELDPKHVKSWLNLSRVLLDAGKPDYALINVHEALERDPESGVGHRLHGRALHGLGKTGEAIDAYREAIRVDSDDVWAMNNLALIYIEQGRFEDALPPLARAVEVRDDIAVVFNNLGMALEHVGQIGAAELAYARAVELDEGYGNALDNFDRVAAVLEDPTLSPLDLQAVAQSFVAEIAGWGDAVVAQDAAEVSAADAIVVLPEAATSETDTTGADR